MSSLPVPGRRFIFEEIPSAMHARELSLKAEEEKIERQKQEIIAQIAIQIECGRFTLDVDGGIPNAIKKELKEKGYKIKKYSNEWCWGETIKWN